MQEDKTGYTNSHGIPVYKGEKTRQGWLQEINRGNTTPKGHTTYYIELIDNPQWFVDSSYTIHPDMKSHMGIFISNGKGGTHTLSCKPKLNTKISTKADCSNIQCNGPNTMDKTLSSSTGGTNTDNNNLQG